MPMKFTQLALLLAALTLSACGNRMAGDRDSMASAYLDDGSPAFNQRYQPGDGSSGSDNTPFIDTDPKASILAAEKEATSILGANGDLRRAVWDKKAGTSGWSAVVVEELKTHRTTLETAQDIEEFCPAYFLASSFERDTCWIRIISAMARYESNFRPQAVYKEANGANSVGLLMMAPEHCPNANTEEKLKVAEPNIQCAVARLALMVKRGKYVSGPNFKGGAAYWSVLRSPHKRGKLNLGRRPHIQEFTKSYLAFREPNQRDHNASAGVYPIGTPAM